MSRNLLQLLSCCCPAAAAAAAAAGALLRDLRSTNHKLEMRGFPRKFRVLPGFRCGLRDLLPTICGDQFRGPCPKPQDLRGFPRKTRDLRPTNRDIEIRRFRPHGFRDAEISNPRISRCGDFKSTDFEMRRFQIHGFRDAEISNPRISRCGVDRHVRQQFGAYNFPTTCH